MCNYSLLTPENIEQIYYPKRGDRVKLTPNLDMVVGMNVKRGDSTIMLVDYPRKIDDEFFDPKPKINNPESIRIIPIGIKEEKDHDQK